MPSDSGRHRFAERRRRGPGHPAEARRTELELTSLRFEHRRDAVVVGGGLDRDQLTELVPGFDKHVPALDLERAGERVALAISHQRGEGHAGDAALRGEASLEATGGCGRRVTSSYIAWVACAAGPWPRRRCSCRSGPRRRCRRNQTSPILARSNAQDAGELRLLAVCDEPSIDAASMRGVIPAVDVHNSASRKPATAENRVARLDPASDACGSPSTGRGARRPGSTASGTHDQVFPLTNRRCADARSNPRGHAFATHAPEPRARRATGGRDGSSSRSRSAGSRRIPSNQRADEHESRPAMRGPCFFAFIRRRRSRCAPHAGSQGTRVVASRQTLPVTASSPLTAS